MEFTCAACGKRHAWKGTGVDGFIHCDCGFRFYVFCHQGMTFTIPAEEIGNESLKEMFRRFVVTTGRCQDASVNRPAGVLDLLKKIDPLALLEIALERVQQETFGNQIMNAGDVEIILEILNQKKDAVVKGQKGYVSIQEVKARHSRREAVHFLQMLEDENAAMPNGPAACLHEDPRRQWQADVMERDAARSGYLFGDVI